MAGAQAQVLSAAQISIWARAKVSVEDLNSAIWKSRTLVRAWCMRRTLFLLPSDELAVFIRGSSRRSAYNLKWAHDQVSSSQELDRILDAMLETLDEPRTRSDLASALKSLGYRMKLKAGGGWGDKRSVPHFQVGSTSLSLGFLLHCLGARDAICSGPSKGAESTYVRADRWVPRWKDMSQVRAEAELLTKYLKAFGPATLADFALWLGVYSRDAKEIWLRESEKIVKVDVDGLGHWILESDLNDLENSKIQQPVVRLLPSFDSFLLGHKSHRSIVEERDHKRVYRGQGWVSPVLLVDGKSLGVWTYARHGTDLEVRVEPFAKLSTGIRSQIKQEAADFGRFLGFRATDLLIA